MPYGKGEWFHEYGHGEEGRGYGRGGEGRGYGRGRGIGCGMRKHEHGYGRLELFNDDVSWLEHRKKMIEEELRYINERLATLSKSVEE